MHISIFTFKEFSVLIPQYGSVSLHPDLNQGETKLFKR